MKDSEHGFTLVELLLSVAIIAILAGLSLPLYYVFATRNDLAISSENLTETLRRAETYARSGNGDSAWGVEIQSTAITLFKGTVFSSRDTTYDEAISIPASVSISGTSEMIFNKLSGVPNAIGSVTLTSSNDTKTVSINAKGMVQD